MGAALGRAGAGGGRPAAAGEHCRAAFAAGQEPHGAGGNTAQLAGRHGGGPCGGAGPERGTGCRERCAGVEPGHRAAEHPGRGRRQPAAGAQRPHPPAGVRGRGGIRSGGAAGRVGGIRIGRVGAGGTALAHECGGGLHGVRDGAGDDPGGRGAGRTRRGGEHRAGVCPDDGTGRGTVKKSCRNKIQSAGHRAEMLATGTGSSCTAVNE